MQDHAARRAPPPDAQLWVGTETSPGRDPRRASDDGQRIEPNRPAEPDGSFEPHNGNAPTDALYRAGRCRAFVSPAIKARLLDDLVLRVSPTRGDGRVARAPWLVDRRCPAAGTPEHVQVAAAGQHRAHVQRFIEPAERAPCFCEAGSRRCNRNRPGDQRARRPGGRGPLRRQVNPAVAARSRRWPRTGAHRLNRATARRPCRCRSRSPWIRQTRRRSAIQSGPATASSSM